MHVDGRTIGISQIQTIQRKGLFLVAVQLESPVGSRSRQLIHDIFIARIDHSHMVSVHYHIKVLVGACHGSVAALEKRHINRLCEGCVADVVIGAVNHDGVDGDDVVLLAAKQQ